MYGGTIFRLKKAILLVRNGDIMEVSFPERTGNDRVLQDIMYLTKKNEQN
jgi:hypothetical protein